MTKGRDLAAESVGDLLAVARSQKRSGMLQAESSPKGRLEEGEIYVLAGQPIYARMGKRVGSDALKRLLGWRKVNFSFADNAPQPVANLTPSAFTSMLEALPRVPAQLSLDMPSTSDQKSTGELNWWNMMAERSRTSATSGRLPSGFAPTPSGELPPYVTQPPPGGFSRPNQTPSSELPPYVTQPPPGGFSRPNQTPSGELPPYVTQPPSRGLPGMRSLSGRLPQPPTSGGPRVTTDLSNGLSPFIDQIVPQKVGLERDTSTLPLSRRQRLIYFLVDGRRSIGSISRCANKSFAEVEQILRELRGQRLITF